MKIAIVMNLDWPLKRYHKIYAGIKSYADSHTEWTTAWDPYPELKLQESRTYYAGIIGRCEFQTVEAVKELGVPIVNTWYSNRVSETLSVFPDYYKAGQLAVQEMIKKGYTNFVSINYKGGPAGKQFVKGINSVIRPKKHSHKKYLIPRDLEKNRKK